jgi:hypothetical protein
MNLGGKADRACISSCSAGHMRVHRVQLTVDSPRLELSTVTVRRLGYFKSFFF